MSEVAEKIESYLKYQGTSDETRELLLGSQPVLEKVFPLLATRTIDLIVAAANLGLYFGANMGLRTIEEQDALYAQGRTKPGKIVTNAKGGQSWHNYGLAIDLVEDGNPAKAGIQWSWANTANYIKMGALTKNAGLSWGGFWKAFKDYPHVELTGCRSLAQAHEFYVRGGLPKVWEAVSRCYEKDSLCNLSR